MTKQLNNQRTKKSTAGFTVVEVVIAIIILTLGLVASVSLIVSTLRANETSLNHLTAANLAQEGLEAIRNIRDSNWLQNYPWNSGGDANFGREGGWNSDFSKSVFGANPAEGIYFIIEPQLNEIVPWKLTEIDGHTDLVANSKMKLNENGIYNYTNGSNTIFSRYLKISYLDENNDLIADFKDQKIKVESKVIWPNKRNNFTELNSVTYLTNWKE